MGTEGTLTKTTENQFADAEHLWFWFVNSSMIRNGIRKNNGEYGCRPCELIDVETLITRMYLCGRLSARELDCLKKYGDKRRGPNQYSYAENRDAALWASAMRTIARAARQKGWIE